MSWTCPKCNSENSDFIIKGMRKTKCLCGYDLLSEGPNTEQNDSNKNLTSIDLYAQAYLLNESKAYNNLLEICTILLNKFPDSKEAKWAIKEFPIKWDRDKKLISYHPEKIPEAFSWKSFLIAILITFIITSIVAAANPGAKPIGFHWTLAWMILTVASWKYWRWQALAPYPAFILCSSLASVVVAVAGGDIGNFVIVGTTMNIVGVTIFAIIYYRRFKKERTKYILAINERKL
jgi:hypothetical protein